MSETEEPITEEQVAEANDEDEVDTEPAPAPEDEPEDEPEPEPEPDTEPDSEAVAEAKGREWDRVAKYLAKNVGDIEGDNAINKSECPMCRSQGTPGYVDPRLHAPPEAVAPILTWLGMRPPDEYRKDPYARECDICGGVGETLSGSRKDGFERVACIPCQGRGWVPVGAERAGGAFAVQNGPSSAIPAPDPTHLDMPAYHEPAPDEAAALRARGYMVIAPVELGQ